VKRGEIYYLVDQERHYKPLLPETTATKLPASDPARSEILSLRFSTPADIDASSRKKPLRDFVALSIHGNVS
jgi:hypothetical protein